MGAPRAFAFLVCNGMWTLTCLGDNANIEPFYISELRIYLIGRKVEICPAGEDKSISRKHSKLVLEKGSQNQLRLTFSDLDSKFGSFHNKEKINTSGCEIKDGDILGFGINGCEVRATFHPLVVCTSRITPADKKEIYRLIGGLTGGYCTDDFSPSVTALIMSGPDLTPDNLTEKALLALINGIPIVEPTWAKAITARTDAHDPWPPFEDYFPATLTPKENFKPTLRTSLMKGLTVAFLNSDQIPLFQRLVSSCSGTLLDWTKLTAYKQSLRLNEGNLIFLRPDEDLTTSVAKQSISKIQNAGFNLISKPQLLGALIANNIKALQSPEAHKSTHSKIQATKLKPEADTVILLSDDEMPVEPQVTKRKASPVRSKPTKGKKDSHSIEEQAQPSKKRTQADTPSTPPPSKKGKKSGSPRSDSICLDISQEIEPTLYLKTKEVPIKLSIDLDDSDEEKKPIRQEPKKMSIEEKKPTKKRNVDQADLPTHEINTKKPKFSIDALKASSSQPKETRPELSNDGPKQSKIDPPEPQSKLKESFKPVLTESPKSQSTLKETSKPQLTSESFPSSPKSKSDAIQTESSKLGNGSKFRSKMSLNSAPEEVPDKSVKGIVTPKRQTTPAKKFKKQGLSPKDAREVKNVTVLEQEETVDARKLREQLLRFEEEEEQANKQGEELFTFKTVPKRPTAKSKK